MMGKIDFIMCGELLGHDRINDNAKRVDGSYDYRNIFANVKDIIKECDLKLAGTETIIGGEELGVSGYPKFNLPYEFADALADAGFNLMLHSSNHSLDRDGEGIINCLNYWRTNYPSIKVAGIYDREEDSHKICVFEKNDIKVAVLNYTYWTNMIEPPCDMTWCVDLLDREKVCGDIMKAKEIADFVIVCPHWGTEYSLEADDSQKKWAADMAEWGADLIIGTHPHVMQPIEKVGDIICAYSLGTFVNWTADTCRDAERVADRMTGYLFRGCLERDRADGKVRLSSYDTIPVTVHIDSRPQKITVYKLSDYSEELADKNEIKKQDPAFSYDYCKKLVEKVIGKH